ncbi:MAG: hypothetical protein AAF638_07890, partial [Pseudomonadota bacterium]
TLPGGTRLLVASDGLLALAPDRVHDLASAIPKPEMLCSRLLDDTREAKPSGLDNTSVIVVQRKSGKKWFSLFR